MRTRRVIGMAAGCALAAGVASAEAPRKSFASLDRLDGETRFGFQYGYHAFDDDDVSGRRLELYGQFAGESVGAYAQVATASIEAGGGRSLSGTSGFEVGAFGVVRQAGLDLVLRGGVSLPLGDGDIESAVTNTYTAFERLTDFANLGANALALRPGLSVLGGSGSLFYRVDTGVDVLIDVSDEGEPHTEDPTEALVRLGAGVGFDGGGGALTAEVVNVVLLTADADDLSDKALHTAAVSLGYAGRFVQPSLAVTVPLDEGVRELVSFVVSASVQVVGLPD